MRLIEIAPVLLTLICMYVFVRPDLPCTFMPLGPQERPEQVQGPTSYLSLTLPSVRISLAISPHRKYILMK